MDCLRPNVHNQGQIAGNTRRAGVNSICPPFHKVFDYRKCEKRTKICVKAFSPQGPRIDLEESSMTNTFRPGWMRPKEAALYFKVHPMTIYRWYYSGKIDGVKLGRQILLLDPNSLDARGVG